MMAGLTTGAVSVSIAQPTEVVKIRMQTAGARHQPQGHQPHGVFRTYRDIARKDGIRGLWRGRYRQGLGRGLLYIISFFK